MCSHSWNKFIAVSSALAGAGVLACAAVILDVFMPKGSLAAFLTSMALLGLVVTGVVIGYAWACDKCESHFSGRLDRLLNGSESNRDDAVNLGAPVNPRSTEQKAVGDARPTPGAPQPPSSRGRYIVTLRGTVSPKDATRATTASAWHGH